jgi:hypothetical protein
MLHIFSLCFSDVTAFYEPDRRLGCSANGGRYESVSDLQFTERGVGCLALYSDTDISTHCIEENGMCVSNLIHMFVFESVLIHSQAWLFV